MPTSRSVQQPVGVQYDRHKALNGTNDTITVTNTAQTAINSIISGGAYLTLGSTSTGTLTLAGVNTYTSATFINGGTVLVQNAAAPGTAAGGTMVGRGGRSDSWGRPHHRRAVRPQRQRR